MRALLDKSGESTLSKVSNVSNMSNNSPKIRVHPCCFVN